MLSTNYKWICTAFVCVIAVFPTTLGDITLYPQEISIVVNRLVQVTIETRNLTKSDVTLTFQHSDMIRTSPTKIVLQPGSEKYKLLVEGLDAGHWELFTTSSDPEIEVDNLYLVANIYKSFGLDAYVGILSWLCLLNLGFSFCPQLIMNIRRQSVVGLSFDFLVFNMVGHISFGIFIQSMYFSPAIQDEYFEKNSPGFIPAKRIDVVVNFCVLFMVSLTIIQCFIYERGGQVLSISGRIILALIGCFYVVVFILRAAGVIQWLDFIYSCLYLTLIITILQYIPQAYMNYVRKSTLGWSIIMVAFNLLGGIFSMTQMICYSYNYNDWFSIPGNPVKFGLGLFTVLFQILFAVQHYALYKNKTDTKI